MIRIIHITVDEKFINAAYEQFAIEGLCNEYHIIVKNKTDGFKYVKKSPGIFVLYPSRQNLKNLAKNIKNSIVVFHGLSFPASIFASYLKKEQNNKLIWFSWGAEFYFNKFIFPKGKYTFLGPLSTILDYEIEKGRRISVFINVFKSKILELFFGVPNRSFLMFRTMSSFRFVAAPFMEEHKLIENKIGNQSKYVRFTYYPLELMTNDLNGRISGNNILIGNSSSSTNNHLEVFELLSNFNIQNRRIYCPLSYGDKLYGSRIQNQGTKIFGDGFFPLLDFLPLEEYNKITFSCGVVIMNHYRQQAFGNVILLIYLGAKLYLDERSSIFSFLQNLGVKFCSIQDDLKPSNKSALDNLSETDVNHNRQIVKAYMSKENLSKSLLKDLVEIASL